MRVRLCSAQAHWNTQIGYLCFEFDTRSAFGAHISHSLGPFRWYQANCRPEEEAFWPCRISLWSVRMVFRCEMLRSLRVHDFVLLCCCCCFCDTTTFGIVENIQVFLSVSFCSGYWIRARRGYPPPLSFGLRGDQQWCTNPEVLKFHQYIFAFPDGVCVFVRSKCRLNSMNNCYVVWHCCICQVYVQTLSFRPTYKYDIIAKMRRSWMYIVQATRAFV